MRVLFVILVLSLVAACAAPDCDPERDGGLGGTGACLEPQDRVM